MALVVPVPGLNYEIQAKDVTFTKTYVEQLFGPGHKAIVSQLFAAAHSEVQTHGLTFKAYKGVSNSKIAFKAARDAAAMGLKAAFDPRIAFQGFPDLSSNVLRRLSVLRLNE